MAETMTAVEVDREGEFNLRSVQSGEWRDQPTILNYRAEWLSNLLVERATWRADAKSVLLDGMQIGGSGATWFRFWLPEPQQIIDKYFDGDGQPVGIYMPIVDPFQFDGEEYNTVHLILGLWLASSGHMTVIGEPEFDAASRLGMLSERQVDWAESRIREVTAEVSRSRLPPPLIRNFMIDKEDNA